MYVCLVKNTSIFHEIGGQQSQILRRIFLVNISKPRPQVNYKNWLYRTLICKLKTHKRLHLF